MIRRFSSRLQKLDASFINERLKGAVSYDRIAGYFRSSILEVAGENLEEITRPNVDGIAYRKIGKRALPFQMISVVDVDSASAAQSLLLNYKAMQGALQTIEDDTGEEWPYTAILQVEHISTKKIKSAVGGISTNKEYLLTCRWSMQATVWYD